MNRNDYRYGKRPLVRKLLSRISHTVTDPVRMYEYATKKIPPTPVGCMMVVWNEQKTIQAAIESSMNFVDRYVVVDKNGETIPLIEEMQEEHNFVVDYFVESDLDLWESRKFALKKLTERWILIQDGDEVFHTSGQFALCNLKLQMCHPHMYLRTRKNMLLDNIKYTRCVQAGYHSFLYHNNGTLRVPGDSSYIEGYDIPRMSGVGIFLEGVYIYNIHINKSKSANDERILYSEEILGEIPDVMKKRFSE